MNNERSTEEHWLNIARAQRWSWAVFILLAITTAFFIKTHFISEAPAAKPARDLIAFWSAGRLALDGTPELAYDHKELLAISKAEIENAPLFHWLYPPSYQLLMMPLAKLDYKAAYFFFMATTLALLLSVASKAIAQKRFLLPAIAFPAIFVTIIFGQNSFLSTSLALLGILMLHKNQWLAGIAIGILTIKPHIAAILMLALALGLHWKALLSATLTSLLLAVLSWLIMGNAVWEAFIESLPNARHLLENGLLKWKFMTSVFVSARVLGLENTTAYFMHAILACAMIVAMAMVWTRSQNINLKASSAALATLTFSPYMFEYELMLLAIPLIFLAKDAMLHGWLKLERETLALTWAFPLINFIQQSNADTSISATPIVAATLMAITLRRMRHDNTMAGNDRQDSEPVHSHVQRRIQHRCAARGTD